MNPQSWLISEPTILVWPTLQGSGVNSHAGKSLRKVWGCGERTDIKVLALFLTARVATDLWHHIRSPKNYQALILSTEPGVLPPVKKMYKYIISVSYFK